jgi:hypothetical protein
MFRFCLVPVLLLPGQLHSKGTISVDAITAMRVCHDNNAASTGPCATAPPPLSKTSPAHPEMHIRHGDV